MKESISLDENQKASENRKFEISKKSNFDGSSTSGAISKM
jgi:hypothetical protein